jgi:hypothetical protein
MEDPGLAEYPREGLLDQVLGFLAGAAEAPGCAIQPVDVVAQSLWIKLTGQARNSDSGRGPGPMYFAVGLISLPSRFCSRM